LREASTGDEALAILGAISVQLVLLDLNLPGLGGLELLHRLLQLKLRVLVFSMHSEPIYVTNALQAGAGGYISKNAAPDEVLTAINAVLAGQSYVEREIEAELREKQSSSGSYLHPLSIRELEILRLLAGGYSLAQISDELGIAYKTAANTCTHIKEKLGITRTADLIRISLEYGLG
jgi:DNA-binding NarL/FixJ family response regulator